MKPVSAKAALIFSLWMLAATGCQPVSAETELDEQPQISRELKLPIVEWRNKEVKTAGVVLAIHGLTLHSKTFDTTARFLADKGYPTYGIDLRGMGRWLTEPEKFDGKKTMDFSLSKSDTVRTLRVLNETYPNVPIFCMGESYGATLSAYVAEKEPELLDGIIVSSFCDKRLWKHPMWRMIPDAVRGFGLPFMACSLTPYTSKLLSPDSRITQAYLEDPLIVRKITAPRLVKTLAENKRVSRRLDEIPQKISVLVLSGGKDGTKSPESMPKVMKKIKTSMEFKSLRKQGHLLLECQPKMNSDTAAVLQKWLDAQSSKQVATHQMSQN